MSEVLRLFVKRVALLFVIAFVCGTFARAAEAAVGDVLWTVNIPGGPTGAQCGASSGTAVTVVPGGKVGFTKIQTLLVTSCTQAGQGQALLPGSVDQSRPRWSRTVVTTNITGRRQLGVAGAASRQGRPHRLRHGVGLAEGLLDRLQLDLPQHRGRRDGHPALHCPAGSTCQGLVWDVTRDVTSTPKDHLPKLFGGIIAQRPSPHGNGGLLRSGERSVWLRRLHDRRGGRLSTREPADSTRRSPAPSCSWPARTPAWPDIRDPSDHEN